MTPRAVPAGQSDATVGSGGIVGLGAFGLALLCAARAACCLIQELRAVYDCLHCASSERRWPTICCASARLVAVIVPWIICSSCGGTCCSVMPVRAYTLDRLTPATRWLTPRKIVTCPLLVPT